VFHRIPTVADESELGELVPVAPEELLTRAALGVPGRLRIEVGLTEPRFAPRQGRRTPKDQLALQRALGGVSYPAERERLIAEAGRWLGAYPRILERLQTLPELTYGGELEVLRKLAELDLAGPTPSEDQPSESEPPSAGLGNQEGSSESK
jgi:hypothetical protein